MDLVQKLVEYAKKILEFHKIMVTWQNEKKTFTQNEIKEQISTFKVYWAKYQSFYDTLIDQARLKPALFKLEYIKNFDAVRLQYDQTLEELFKLKYSDLEATCLINSNNEETYSLDELDDLIYEKKTVSTPSPQKISKRPSIEKICEKSPKSRRKPTHENIRDDDDSITFESCVLTDDELNNSKIKPSTSKNNNKKEDYTDSDDDEESNQEIMKTVSCVRSIANYLMLNLNYGTVEYKRSCSLHWLMTKYLQKKNNLSEPITLEQIYNETTIQDNK